MSHDTILTVIPNWVHYTHIGRHAVLPVDAAPADALFTKTQQRVLRVLFGQPERSFYATELIREAGTGSGAAQRELARLNGAGYRGPSDRQPETLPAHAGSSLFRTVKHRPENGRPLPSRP